MAVLIVDNYDSFTYNLVDAVAKITGCSPIVIRNDEMAWDQVRRLEFDSVIISPGPGRPVNPRDFGISARLIAEAAEGNFPLLGVCLGHQGIAHHFGGSVISAPEPVHGRSAAILHDGDELFAGVPDRFSAVRYHSLIVGEPLPPELRKIAWTSDGVVMALRHITLPIWGVQFHPESICTQYGETILRNFLKPLAHARGSVTTCGSVKTVSIPRRERTMHVHARQIPLPASPETLFRGLFSHQRYAFWLDSSLVSDDSRFSYMGAASEVIPAPFLDSLDRELRGITVPRLRCRSNSLEATSAIWAMSSNRNAALRGNIARRFPMHVCCAWIASSPSITLKTSCGWCLVVSQTKKSQPVSPN